MSSANSGVRLVNHLRASISHGRGWSALAEARKAASIGQYRSLVTTAYRVPGKHRYPLLPVFSRDLPILLSHEPPDALDLRHELEWVSLIIERNAAQLRTFVQEKASAQALILEGDDKGALELIERIERTLGFSAWGVKAKVALLQLVNGQDAQKDYTSQILSGNPGLLRAIAHLSSQRNEDAVSMAGFRHRAMDTIDGWDVPLPWKAYLRYALLGIVPTGETNIADLLVTASTGSCIDLFEAASDMIETQPNAVTRANQRAVVRIHAVAACDSLDAMDGLKLVLSSASSGAPSSDPQNLREKCISQLSSVLHRVGDSSEGYAALEKTCRNFSFLTVLRCTEAIARAITARDVLRVSEIRSIAGRLSSSQPAALGLFSDEALLRELERAFDVGDEAAVQLACERLARGDILDRVAATKYRFAWEMANGRWEAAIELAVDCIVEIPGASSEFPLADVLRDKTWLELKKVRQKAHLALAMSYASADFLPGHEAQRFSRNLQQIALQQLRELGCARFSEMVEGARYSLVTRRFLSDVCTQQVMEVNVNLSSSRDLSMERMKICQALVTIDAERSSRYLEEIRQITYANELEEGIRNFDSSRLFVNQEGLVEWAQKNLEEDFSRYRSLRNTSLPDLAEIKTAILSMHTDRDAAVPQALLEQPKTEADRLLIDLAQRLLREFLHGTQFGLNSYLSLRIRHGSLAGHLRGPLEEAGAIALRESAPGAYQRISRWDSLLEGLGNGVKEAFHSAFSRFSDRFDVEVTYLVDELLQIRSDSKPNGSFDLSVNAFLMNLLKGSVDDTTDVQDFAKVCIAHFKASLDPDLVRVRLYISRTFKATVDKDFDELLKAIDALDSGGALSPVADAVKRARTSLSFAADRVSDWFQSLDRGDHERRYSIEQIIRMGERLTTNTRPAFLPVVTIDAEGDIPDFTPHSGAFLVADALFIVFDNAYLHSGIEGRIAITVKVTLTSEKLVFDVLNEAAHGCDSEESRARLEEIRAKMQSGEYSKMAFGEGGTGLFKLMRLTEKSASEPEESLTFGFEAEGFRVKFQIPIREAIVEDEENENSDC